MNKRKHSTTLLFCITLTLSLSSTIIFAQQEKQGKLASKPLFRDPVYDGAADPTVIWNRNEKNVSINVRT